MDDLDKRLLNDFQRDLPLTPRPFAAIAEQLGQRESEVLLALGRLQEQGTISRVGAVVAPHRAGVSTLAALAVPPAQLDEIADLVNSYPEVNHNYEREHDYNLWFVLTAPDQARLDAVLADIEQRTGLAVLDLPLEREFHIDLGFRMEL
ncbi:MAG: AsnC family transcriptional regulator [Gammaproteobacteria bacterium]